MDSDLVIGILMILFWFVSSLIARFARRHQSTETGEGEPDRAPASRPPAVPKAPPRPGVTLEKALRDLAGQMGVELEPQPAERPVASEHAATASEHRRTAIEIQSTLSEHAATRSEHRRTASEARRTVSETIFEAPEHRLTPSEHRRGDVRSAAIPAVGRARSARGSRFARRVRTDLAGRSSLTRAIVLREILGPPVGLRSPERDRS